MVFVGFQAMFAIITVGADLRCDRGADEVRRLDRVLGRVGDHRLLPGRALGLRLHDGQTAAGSPTSWARSTSPAAPPCTSTPARPPWRWRWSWASARARARSRCGRTTCRSSCSAPDCCGSGGSASTPDPRSLRTAPPAVGVDQHPGRHGGRRDAGWILTRRSGTATPPRSARHRVVAGWWRSRRRAASVTPVGAILVGLARWCCASLAVGMKTSSASTTPWTWWRSTSSAVWGHADHRFVATAAAPAGVDGLFYGGGIDRSVAPASGRWRCSRTPSG